MRNKRIDGNDWEADEDEWYYNPGERRRNKPTKKPDDHVDEYKKKVRRKRPKPVVDPED